MTSVPFSLARQALLKWASGQPVPNEEAEELMTFLGSQARRMIKGRSDQDYEDLSVEFLTQYKIPSDQDEEKLWQKFTWAYFSFLHAQRKAWGMENAAPLCDAGQIHDLETEKAPLDALEDAGRVDLPADTQADLARIRAMISIIRGYFKTVTDEQLLALLLNMDLDITQKKLGLIFGITDGAKLTRLKKSLRISTPQK